MAILGKGKGVWGDVFGRFSIPDLSLSLAVSLQGMASVHADSRFLLSK